MSKRKRFSNAAKKARKKWTNDGFARRKRNFPDALIGVAEGDSWFDYSPAWLSRPHTGDLPARLNKTEKYNLWCVGDGGDTLENMVYGTKYKKKDYAPIADSLTSETLRKIEEKSPDFFLFSGGGNDIAGVELESLLNHKDSGLPVFRDATDELFAKTVPKAYNHLIEKVLELKPDIHIFFHGYGYPDPTGKGILKYPFGYKFFVGPWLRPALTKKRYTGQTERRNILKDLINRFNETQIDIANANSQVHHIDLRPHLNYKDWDNELHLKADKWDKVVKRFSLAIDEVFE